MSGAVRSIGKVVGSLFGMPDMSQMQQQAPIIIPQAPALQAPVAPPSIAAQAASVPDEADARADRARRMPGGAKSATMLTGAGGIDPLGLNIGKTGKSLLGL